MKNFVSLLCSIAVSSSILLGCASSEPEEKPQPLTASQLATVSINEPALNQAISNFAMLNMAATQAGFTPVMQTLEPYLAFDSVQRRIQGNPDLQYAADYWVRMQELAQLFSAIDVLTPKRFLVMDQVVPTQTEQEKLMALELKPHLIQFMQLGADDKTQYLQQSTSILRNNGQTAFAAVPELQRLAGQLQAATKPISAIDAANQ